MRRRAQQKNHAHVELTLADTNTAVQGENNNGGKDRKSGKSYVKVAFLTSLPCNHLGRSPAEFMLSQFWIGSHVRPLKTSTPNMAISFPSAAVYQCHTGSTMQNPF